MSCRSCTAATTRCSSPHATRPGVRAAAPGSAHADNAARSCQLCERMPSGAHGGAWGFAPAGLRWGHGGARGSGRAEGGALQSRAAPTTFVTSDEGFACGEHPRQEHHDRCRASAGMAEAAAAAALRRRPMARHSPGLAPVRGCERAQACPCWRAWPAACRWSPRVAWAFRHLRTTTPTRCSPTRRCSTRVAARDLRYVPRAWNSLQL